MSNNKFFAYNDDPSVYRREGEQLRKREDPTYNQVQNNCDHISFDPKPAERQIVDRQQSHISFGGQPEQPAQPRRRGAGESHLSLANDEAAMAQYRKE